jgi:hypothetical protein
MNVMSSVLSHAQELKACYVGLDLPLSRCFSNRSLSPGS